MARDNYSYKKYMREKAKAKKKEEKLQKKLDKKKAQAEGVVDPGQVAGGDVPADPGAQGQ